MKRRERDVMLFPLWPVERPADPGKSLIQRPDGRQRMFGRKPAPDLIRGGGRFADKSMRRPE
jgi:hypothetical protein